MISIIFTLIKMSSTTKSEEFIVYLKSDENKGEFPNNTPSAFTNRLNPSIVLTSDYEVCLQNIICKKKFGAIPGNNSRYNIRVFVEFLEKNGTSRNATGFVYTPDVSISGKNIEDSIQHLDHNFRQNLIRNRLIDDTQGPIFQYNVFTQKVELKKISPLVNSKYSGYKIKWKFSSGMVEFLGIDDKSNDSYRPVFKHPCSLYTPDVIYVFTDCITTSSICSQNVHILDIIPFGENVYAKNSVTPLYKDVNKSVLDSISLKICDEYGENVAFDDDVNIVAVLHFRPC